MTLNKSDLLTHVHLLGHKFRTGNGLDVLNYIHNVISETSDYKYSIWISHYNLHCLALSNQDEGYKRTLNSAQAALLDGAPVIWALSALGYDISIDDRSTMLDWLPKLFELSDNENYRIFMLGSDDAAISTASKRTQANYKNIHIKEHHGYLDSHANEKNNLTKNVLEKIKAHKTDILLVGMGMPAQEIWITKNLSDIEAKVIIPVGGYFDYIAGLTYTPPRWTGPLGLEWLARLIMDPKRLAYRYLIEPWPVFYRIALEIIRKKR